MVQEQYGSHRQKDGLRGTTQKQKKHIILILLMAMPRLCGGLQKLFHHARGCYGSQLGTAVFSGLILSGLVSPIFLQVVVFMQFMRMFQVHYGWAPREKVLFKPIGRKVA